jgi:hypothetical protein
MKRFILGILLVLSVASAALADAFQFVSQANGAYASGAAVDLDGKLLGYTDNYGRIIISLPPGRYPVAISFLGQRTLVPLTVTGAAQLQVVNF